MLEVFPILFIFLGGYLYKNFFKDISSFLVNVVLYFIFPVFIIYKIHFLELNNDIYVVIILGLLAFCLGIFYSLLFGKIFKFSKNTIAMIAMGSAFGNTSFLGFAFVQALYGDYALSLAIFYDQIAVMVTLSIFAPLICSYGGEGRFSILKVLKSIITFPPTIAFFVALVTKKIVFYSELLELMYLISLSLVPIVVFAVGMKFRLASVKEKRQEIVILILIKMFIIPLSVFLVGILFFPYTIALQVAILEAAMPPMVVATIIAVKNGLDEELGVGALGVGMLLSFITIPLFYYVL